MIKELIFFLAFILFLNIAFAATIHGTIYDLNLDKVDKALVTVDTQPEQKFISVDGSYSFYVPDGSYVVRVSLIEGSSITASASEDLEVNDDGDFVVDLVLFPNFDEELGLIQELEDIKVDGDLLEERSSIWIYVIILLVVLAIAFFILYKIRKRHGKGEFKKDNVVEEKSENKEVLDDEKSVIDIIKQNENRITQKEIRKKLGMSETKISLVIADLEDKGILRKIKKGRGNIIILKEKKK